MQCDTGECMTVGPSTRAQGVMPPIGPARLAGAKRLGLSIGVLAQAAGAAQEECISWPSRVMHAAVRSLPRQERTKWSDAAARRALCAAAVRVFAHASGFSLAGDRQRLCAEGAMNRDGGAGTRPGQVSVRDRWYCGFPAGRRTRFLGIICL